MVVESMKEFLKKVYPEPNTGCWLWGGAYNSNGYGTVYPMSHKSFNLAHRYSYFIYKGGYNLKLNVLHSCDNPACVNPDHLFLGTQNDNVLDRHKKGRTANGVKIKRAKLDVNKVLEIRKLYATGKHSFSTLSKLYDVGDAAISKIINRQNWSHVD